MQQRVFFQHVGLLSSSGHLDPAEKVEDAHPKLWCALNEGKVIVFDASSWTIHQHCFRVGTSRLVSKRGAVQRGQFSSASGSGCSFGERACPPAQAVDT